MKKIIVTLWIMIFNVIMIVSAECDTDIQFEIINSTITIEGTAKKNSVYTVNVTSKEDGGIYAIDDFSSDDTGIINKKIILPDNVPPGTYSLVLGGTASQTTPLSKRTFEFNIYREDIDIEYVDGTVSGTMRKGGTFNSSVTLKSNTVPEDDIIYVITLKHRGSEVVSREIIKPASESMGEYTITMNAQIPYLAPDSRDYTLEILIKNGMFSDGEQIKTISELTVGTPAEKAIQPEAEFKSIYFENNKLFILSDVENADGIYAKFIKNSALYGVAECSYSQFAELVVPQLPAGEYEVIVGFYGMRGESDPIIYVEENGVDKKPYSYGTYINPETKNQHFWYINENGALIRDGEPYIPMGGMICLNTITGYNKTNDWVNRQNWVNDKKRLQEIYDKGVRDIYINCVNDEAPVWVMTELCNYLDSVGFKYGIQYGTDKLDKELYYIRANEGKKVIYGAEGTVSMDCSDVNGTLIGGFITAVKSGRAVYSGECRVDGKTLIGVLPEGIYDVYFTPKVTLSVATFNDFWNNIEYFEETREDYARQLNGENLMTVIDPVANETGMYNYLESIRPHGDEYNALFKNWLVERYTLIENLEESWGVSNVSFDIAARLIPVYTNTNSFRVYCVDEYTGEIYNLDGQNGIMWQDYLEFRDASYAEFYNDVANAIKRGADVPVIIKNVWGHKEYFINKRLVGGFDGLGAESYGDYGNIAGKTFSNYGMTKQFAKTAWSIVTETSTDENTINKYESGQYGYGSQEYMTKHFDTHFENGARGIYDFVISCPHDAIIQTAYSYEENPEQFEWLNIYYDNLDHEKIAYEPFEKTTVALMNFNSNFYTVPNRWTAVLPKQYSEVYGAYISEYYGLWQTEDVMECDILAATFENKPSSIIWGKRFSEAISDEDQKVLYVGFRKDLGTVPELDKYFTSRFSENENGVRVQILNTTNTADVLASTNEGEPYAIRDGNLYIIAAEDATAASGLNYIEEIGILYDKLGFYADTPIVADDTGDEVSFTATVYNTYDKTMSGKIIVATYDEKGKITQIEFSDFSIGRGVIDLDINITPASDDKTIKCFVFGENIRPISQAQTKEVNH